MNKPIRNWNKPGTCGRTAMENRDRAIAQSAGVKFGVLPERQTDLDQLAREIRATPTGTALDAAFLSILGTTP